MSGLKFVKNYGGRRVENEFSLKPFFPVEDDDESESSRVDSNIEFALEDWRAINTELPKSWRAQDWKNRPVRFVDGKDVGQTVAWLRGLDGSFVALRLAEIGSVVIRISNGELKRESAHVERVLAMNTAVFPWEEVENFALALREQDIYLLPTRKTKPEDTLNFEEIRHLAQRRTVQEMNVLEEFAISQHNDLPMIIDGNLKSHESGFDIENSPIFGVVKTFTKNHLSREGQDVMFNLKEGQRTPAFQFFGDTSKTEEQDKNRLPLIAWYVRLCSNDCVEPNVGIVRIEVSQKWFHVKGYGETKITAIGKEFINQLTRTIYEYRCRKQSYRRMKMSLDPIVRAEESLGALFCPPNYLKNQFYRLTNL